MKRREFLLVSAGGLLAARISARVLSGSVPVQETPTAEEATILPLPFSVSRREGRFLLSDDVIIVIPSGVTTDELVIAERLRDELADWLGLILTIKDSSAVPRGSRVIMVGMSKSPFIRAALDDVKAADSDVASLPESYSLHVRPNVVVISGADSRGLHHGFQ